jgi:hypothetical protein
MQVQLASKLDPSAEAQRLGQWATNYRNSGGQGGPGGLLAPARVAGERWVAMIRGVSRDEIDQRDLADPDVLLGHGRARDPAHQAWVSPQRVVFASGRRVLAAWPLEELFAVQALDDLTGVVLLGTEPNPDYDDRFPALLSDVVPWSARAPGPAPPGYDRRRVEVDWLKFEAVFAASRDRLDEWTRELDARLTRIVSRAQVGHDW